MARPHRAPNGNAQRDAAPALHRFDPEARIVGTAPAFAQAARTLGLAPHEHLVIPLTDHARLAQRTFQWHGCPARE